MTPPRVAGRRAAGPSVRGRPGADAHWPLRRALGRYPTGVAIVTTLDRDGRPVGLTVNSFTSLSMDPPMVLWCLHRTASSLPAFRASTHFTVNILAADQDLLARQFASRPLPERFAGVRWAPGGHGLPVLAGTVGQLTCRRVRYVRGGDHLIVLGLVESHYVTASAPLVFHDGGFGSPVWRQPPGPTEPGRAPPGSRAGTSIHSGQEGGRPAPRPDARPLTPADAGTGSAPPRGRAGAGTARGR